MSVNGRFRPVRGTARGILLALRRGQTFAGPVDRLAAIVGVAPNAIWRALAVLADRRMVIAHGAGDGCVTVKVTRFGRECRL
jgi:hypothetical protein